MPYPSPPSALFALQRESLFMLGRLYQEFVAFLARFALRAIHDAELKSKL